MAFTLDDITVEVRDPDLKIVGQVSPENLPGARFINRFNNTGAWQMFFPFDDALGDLLRTPGYGIRVLLTQTNETLISGPTLSAKLTQTPDDVRGRWLIEGSSDELVLQERLAYPDPSQPDVTAQTVSHDRRTGAAETVIKGYVEDNMGPSAPTVREVPNFVVATDTALGPTVDVAARFTKIQDLIYGIAESAGLGYEVKQVANQLVFDVFEPVDRSSTIRMDIENNQITSVNYEYGAPRTTRAIVAGPGEAVDRLFIERTSTESLAAESLWGRRVETFQDARQSETVEELESAGDENLAENGKTIESLEVVPSDDITMTYGRDWFLGDVVTVVSGFIETVATVTEVGVSISFDGVRVAAVVGDPELRDFDSRLVAKVNKNEERISSLERNEPLPVVGQVSRITTGTVTITTTGAYVSTGLSATFDTSTANGIVQGTTDTFGIKNNTSVTRIMRVYASADARGGNNQIHGIKLALNGTPIDQTECRAFTGSSNQEAKLVTSWVIRMEPGDEVSLFIANHSTTDNIEIRRGRVLATAA